MKRFFLILMTACLLCLMYTHLAYAGDPRKRPDKELPRNRQGKIVYEDTIIAEGSKDKLYEHALQWIAAQSFSKPEKGVEFKEVISYQNKEEGKIFGNGKFKFETKYAKLGYYDYMYMTFSFKLYLKDGQCKYIFSDFVVNRLTWHKRDHIGAVSFEDYSDTRYYRRHSDESIKGNISKLISDLKKAMSGNL